jgi:hypothetical protein
VPLATALGKNLPAENTQRERGRTKPTGVAAQSEKIDMIHFSSGTAASSSSTY